LKAEFDGLVSSWAAPVVEALEAARETYGHLHASSEVETESDADLLEAEAEAVVSDALSLRGALEAGVAAGMQVRTVSQAKTKSVSAAQLVTAAYATANPPAAAAAGSNVLNAAAQNFILSKIGGDKILQYAMSTGPLAAAVLKFGPAAVETPVGKQALAQAQQDLAAKVLMTTSGRALMQKIQEKKKDLVALGESAAILQVEKNLIPAGGLVTPVPPLSTPAGLAVIKQHAAGRANTGKF